MNEQQKELFVISLRETGLEATAAKTAGVTRRRVQLEYERDELFEEECRDIIELHADRLEQEAVRRAVEGVPKGIYHKGELVGEEQQYSDMLLAKLLTGRRPAIFGDKREISGANGGAIQVVIQDFSDDNDFL